GPQWPRPQAPRTAAEGFGSSRSRITRCLAEQVLPFIVHARFPARDASIIVNESGAPSQPLRGRSGRALPALFDLVGASAPKFPLPADEDQPGILAQASAPT